MASSCCERLVIGVGEFIVNLKVCTADTGNYFGVWKQVFE